MKIIYSENSQISNFIMFKDEVYKNKNKTLDESFRILDISELNNILNQNPYCQRVVLKENQKSGGFDTYKDMGNKVEYHSFMVTVFNNKMFLSRGSRAVKSKTEQVRAFE